MPRRRAVNDASRRAALIAAAIVAAVLSAGGAPALPAELPNRPGTLKFAVIGDNGTGERPQFEVAEQMAAARRRFPYELVIMLGDNFYGAQRPADLVKKFERPYKPLLDAGVTFHAALGNHDAAGTVSYAPLNMAGQRYYTFARQGVRFFVLDTNELDTGQLEWLGAALAAADEDWKICYFHHPLYSSATRHGAATDLRVLLEPLLVRYGVDVVFSGHDHSYERLKPQKGITYFVSGAGGKLRRGGIRWSALTAAAFDQDQSWMLVEVDEWEMHFEAISRTGRTVDAGVILREPRGNNPVAGGGR
jgi:predicted MPP superfamily phosphohydrolase